MNNQLEIKIRVYKAIDNLAACKRFADGHANVLLSYGIKQVTSSNTSWFTDPYVYVVMVESVCGKNTFGGARLHLKNSDYKLPIETALEQLDPNISKIINPQLSLKTGELCGLWNTKGMSGSGLSAMLIRTGVAKAGIFIAEKYNLQSIYTLSAPWTKHMVENIGFEVEKSLGENGTFAYPKPDLIATLLKLKDVKSLEKALPLEKDKILSLRVNPIQKCTEDSPIGAIEVEYDLIMEGNNLENELFN